MAISGAIPWGISIDPLNKTGNIELNVLFVAYITFVHVFILNVVTGVFCSSAIEGAQQDLDITIEDQLKDKQVYVARLMMLLKEMRRDDDDGELTAAELEFQLSRPKVQSWFKTLDIDTKHAWKLFRILDTDNSENFSTEEFVEGCLHLKGMATRVDVESLKWEIRDANKRLYQALRNIAELAGHRTESNAEGAYHPLSRPVFDAQSPASSAK